LIIDHFRSSSRTIQTDFEDERTNDVASDDWTADDWASMRELAAALRVAIDGLSARDAAVIELATTFGFGAAEIGAALDIESGHARVLLHRARRSETVPASQRGAIEELACHHEGQGGPSRRRRLERRQRQAEAPRALTRA
jgi:DNA-directed RNA polymerase specialized sigma24 family protein